MHAILHHRAVQSPMRGVHQYAGASRAVRLVLAKRRDVQCSSGALRILANVSGSYSYCSVTTTSRWSVCQKTGKVHNFWPSQCSICYCSCLFSFWLAIQAGNGLYTRQAKALAHVFPTYL